jgi:hypothetical protein
MVYFKPRTERLPHGAALLYIEVREDIDDRLLAVATLIMDPRMGSVLGEPIVEERVPLPAVEMEALLERAAQEAAAWAA